MSVAHQWCSRGGGLWPRRTNAIHLPEQHTDRGPATNTVTRGEMAVPSLQRETEEGQTDRPAPEDGTARAGVAPGDSVLRLVDKIPVQIPKDHLEGQNDVEFIW